jgi:hypothetical protein
MNIHKGTDGKDLEAPKAGLEATEHTPGPLGVIKRPLSAKATTNIKGWYMIHSYDNRYPLETDQPVIAFTINKADADLFASAPALAAENVEMKVEIARLRGAGQNAYRGWRKGDDVIGPMKELAVVLKMTPGTITVNDALLTENARLRDKLEWFINKLTEEIALSIWWTKRTIQVDAENARLVLRNEGLRKALRGLIQALPVYQSTDDGGEPTGKYFICANQDIEIDEILYSAITKADSTLSGGKEPK